MSVSAFIGCMFSGKTSRMLLEGEREERAGKKVIYLKSHRDVRYDDDITLTCSHDGHTMRSTPVPEDDLLNVVIGCGDADVICIDEAQFMDNLIEFCESMANIHGKHIIIAALDGDFNREPFPNISQLLGKCERIKKMCSICVECGDKASFTRKVAGSMTTKVEIGGSDLYVPTCRKHHSGDLSKDTLPRMKATNDKLNEMKSV